MMYRTTIALAVLALAAGPFQAYADDIPANPDTAAAEAKIHFANSGGIYNWQADGTQALYIEDRQHRWYHARLLSPCMNLPFTQHVGFETEPGGDFDNFSAIVTGHEKCQVTSLVTSDKPGAKK